MRHAAEWDDVADPHRRRVDEDAVDQQLDQLAPTGEGCLVEPVGDGGPEGFRLVGEHSDLSLLLRTRRKLLSLPAEVGEPGFQGAHAGLQLFERDRSGGVGIDEALALAVERGALPPEVVPAGGARVVAAPASLRPPYRLVEHRRVAAHLTAVGPDDGIAGAGGDGLLLAARVVPVGSVPRPWQAPVVCRAAVVADALGPPAATAADEATREVLPLRVARGPRPAAPEALLGGGNTSGVTSAGTGTAIHVSVGRGRADTPPAERATRPLSG